MPADDLTREDLLIGPYTRITSARFIPYLPLPVSGRYVRRELSSFGAGISVQIRPAIVETLRLDVDGWYPQQAASGTYARTLISIQGPIDWVAYPLTEVKPGIWEGQIVRTWSQWGSTIPFKFNKVRIETAGAQVAVFAPKITVTFSDGAPAETRVFEFESPYFRTAEFEFDTVQDAVRVTSIDTCAHANHPASFPCQVLPIAEAYSRAGVEVLQSPNPSSVPLSLAGGDNRWSVQELNDAMRTYWSRYKARTQWALWLLWAGRYYDPDRGADNGVLGTMFDYSGANQRQGAAIFSDVYTDTDVVASSYPQRDAHVRRLRYFGAVHESGHCFNLAHSWRKTVNPWWPVSNEPDAISFMNYPQRIGVETFFKEFEYRFSDRELKFLRHAPESFVEMADAPFETNHGFDPSLVDQASGWALTVSVGRQRGLFEFLEPVTIGVKLINVSDRPQVIDTSILDDAHSLTVSLTRRGGRTRFWRPYAHVCRLPTFQVLQPGEAVENAFFIGAGMNGWDLAEPGAYTIEVALQTDQIEVAARPLPVRVASPRSWDEEWAAQEFFTEDVGRALAFGGTSVMTQALNALQEVADRLPDRAVARHARLALALPAMRDQKILRLPDGEAPIGSVAADQGQIAIVNARPDEARRLLDTVLLDDRRAALETFGEWTYRRQVERYGRWLDVSGNAQDAERVRRRGAGNETDDPTPRPSSRPRRPRKG